MNWSPIQINQSILGYLLLSIGMSILGYLAVSIESYWLTFLPIVIILTIYILTGTIQSLYLITAFLIPFTTELELAGGIALAFPGELMFLLLTGLGIFIVMNHDKPSNLFNYGTLLITLHVFWLGFSSIFAEFPLLSFKYFLAKLWFLIPCYVLPFYIFRKQLDFDRFLTILVWASFLAGVYVFVRHGLEGWSFATRTNIGRPFFRNHVNYACLLLMIIPSTIYLYQRGRGFIYLIVMLLFLIFIYFTYARIIYIALLSMSLLWVCYRLRLVKVTVLMGILGISLAISYFVQGDRLLHYAPDYETTVSHARFDRLLEASVKFKDISAMERAHRWMAGLEMIKDRPWTGFGPANFYSCYQPYTINSFQTYVSDNPEKSGIHNYYLMVLVEQGVIGLLIFLSLIFVFYWKVSKLRNSDIDSPIVVLALSWMTGILTLLLLNDMLEVIKLGPFYFLALWIIMNTSHDQVSETSYK